MGAAIPIALGAATAGLSAWSISRQRKAQQKVATEAARESFMQGQQTLAAAQAQDAAVRQQQTEFQQEAERRRQAAVASLGPASDLKALRGLATIATSPLGDTSEPNLGRRKLLGN